MVYLFLKTESVRTRWRRKRALALFALDRRVRFSLRENSMLVFKVSTCGRHLLSVSALRSEQMANELDFDVGASERRTR